MKEDYQIIERLICEAIPEITHLDLNDEGAIVGYGCLEIEFFNETVLAELNKFFTVTQFSACNHAINTKNVFVEFRRSA